MIPIPVNGIRLGPGLVWTGQNISRTLPATSVCETLSTRRINMVCAGLHREASCEWFSGCVESRYRDVLARLAEDTPGVSLPADVVQVSVYPHRRRLEVPAALLRMLKTGDIPFYHLVSSPAVICVIIDARFQDQMIALLESTFALPASHTPYIQEIDQDISALLKKYPETRSTFVEEKIRTYGIQLTTDLFMHQIRDSHDRLTQTGKNMAASVGSDALFHLVSAIRTSDRIVDILFVVDPGPGAVDGTLPVDLITFHGPHFGDRYRILQTALDCLARGRVPLHAAACAGASISLVFPAGDGETARTALTKGFEAP